MFQLAVSFKWVHSLEARIQSIRKLDIGKWFVAGVVLKIVVAMLPTDLTLAMETFRESLLGIVSVSIV